MLICQKILKNIIYNLPIKFLLRNYILFESNPDYMDNTYYVYKELLNQNYNNKYKFIWFVNNKEDFDYIKIKNVKFINIDSFNARYYRIFAKFIIDCNRYITKFNKYQFRFYLGHGMPIKIVTDYIKGVGDFDAFLTTAEYFNDFYIKYVNQPKEKFLPLGFPRCDQFYEEKEVFDELKTYSKTILWMPTFRKHINGNVGYKSKLIYGVPSINNEKEILKLNDKLKNNNSLLIIKLHPAEDSSFLKKLNLSNILFTKNELLEKNKKNIYQLAQNVDALITDYSSIYFDYLVADKPIGMAIEDIEEYRKNNGLVFNNFEDELPAEYIYNYNDLVKFIDNVINNKDIKKNERNEKRSTYVKYVDGSASKRVIEVLKEHSL